MEFFTYHSFFLGASMNLFYVNHLYSHLFQFFSRTDFFRVKRGRFSEVYILGGFLARIFSEDDFFLSVLGHRSS